MKSKLTSLLVLLCFAASPVFAATYSVDRDHSTVQFKVRHLFSQVRGNFNEFKGTLNYDAENPDAFTAEGEIQAASIDTNVEARDKHLRSADFFDVENHPAITFKSTEVTDVDGDMFKLHGMLQIHGVEKPVVLEVQVHGQGKDPWGNTRLGLTATTMIDRKEFGITWNKAVETGGVLVGDQIEIILEIEGKLEQ